MRAPNSIDFWRGFALVTIFVNHVPGIVFESFSFREYSLSDSAELFVFLAGFSLRFVVNSLADEPLSALVYRLAGRALTIYFAQILITLFAIAIIAARRPGSTSPISCNGIMPPRYSKIPSRRISASSCCATSSAISTSCRSMSC